jgi:hypothetical protein
VAPAGPVATSAPSPAPTRTTTTAPPGQSSTRASEEAAAIAVVRKYVTEFNEALKSGRTTAFRATFKPSCALCLGDAMTIDEYTRSNKRIAGGAYTLITPRAVRMSSGQFLVQAELSQTAARILDRNGRALDKFAVVPRFGFTWTTKPIPGGTLIIVDSVPS